MFKGIGIMGRARHGKDSVANILVDEFGYERVGFADELKRDVASLLREEDAGPLPVSDLDWINGCKHIPAVRTLLQSYGESQRAINGEDYWIERLFNYACQWHIVLGRPPLVIPDVRYRNEADALKARGFTLLRVVRRGFDGGLTPEQAAHASETDLDGYAADFTIMNYGDLDDLRRNVLAWHRYAPR